MTGNNPNLDFVHVKAYSKFGQFLTICSEDMSRNKILTSFKGHDCYKWPKIDW